MPIYLICQWRWFFSISLINYAFFQRILYAINYYELSSKNIFWIIGICYPTENVLLYIYIFSNFFFKYSGEEIYVIPEILRWWFYARQWPCILTHLFEESMLKHYPIIRRSFFRLHSWNGLLTMNPPPLLKQLNVNVVPNVAMNVIIRCVCHLKIHFAWCRHPPKIFN